LKAGKPTPFAQVADNDFACGTAGRVSFQVTDLGMNVSFLFWRMYAQETAPIMWMPTAARFIWREAASKGT